MSIRAARLALTSIGLNLFSLLVYALAISGANSHRFTLATELLSLMGVINLALSVIALARSFRPGRNKHTRRIAWVSLAVAISMMLVIGILLLDIWVYNFQA